MKDRILTLSDAARIVPLSKTTLYRVAERGGESSPFRKVEGRWLTVESDLIAWVRGGHRPDSTERNESVADLMEEVRKRRRG